MTMSASASGKPVAPDRVRLHITPFYPELLDKIIAPSLRSSASNISFHSVQTFPERAFGYVELPAMEAQKLKTKLNGATLKGAKVRIEEAKPEKKRKGGVEDGDADKKAREAAKKEKRKQEEGVISGRELEDGRRVKRGWSEDGADDKASGRKNKKSSKSKDTDDSQEGRKLRFKTSVPPNVAPVETKDKSKKKSKEGKKDKKDQKVVVEEFGKSKKSANPSATINASKHGAVTFEDGVGWVDESGNVVEIERESKKSKRNKGVAKPEVAKPEVATVESEDTSMSDDHAENEEGKEQDEATAKANGTASESSSESESQAAIEDDTNQPAKEVHPLEALFKRPGTSESDSSKRRPKPIDTSFSFFDPNAADGEDEQPGGMPPQTPHTKRDLEWRTIRSAAPTPDTAAIGRKFSFPFAGEEEDDENDDDDDDDDEDEEDGEMDQDVDMEDPDQAQAGAAQVDGQDRGEESAFRKWFYDNRGDLNRGWKKRRREERKQSRQRENRRLNRKIA